MTTVPAEVTVGMVEYAGWGRRAGALLLDGAVVWTAIFVASAVVSDVIAAFSVFVFAAYATVGHGRRTGQTVGKAALGIAVRHERTFGPLGYGRALARWLVTFVFWTLLFLPGLLDALSPLWTERRRAWHDRVAGSIVIRI